MYHIYLDTSKNISKILLLIKQLMDLKQFFTDTVD